MEDTKDRILGSALKLFSEKGYAGASTKSIAQEAGVNEVTLFRLFGNKRELYLAVFRRFIVTPGEGVLFSSFDGTPRDDFASVCRAITSLFINNNKIVLMCLKDMESFPEIDAELRSQPETLVSLVSAYFRRARKELCLRGNPERMAGILVNSLMGTVLHLHRFRSDEDTRTFIDEFSDVLYRGMTEEMQR